ncbi:hypothetical protein F5884DRAFT_670945 [Xylogone sp. PMI_703]|nr:hypothetical protein F5884DRAFT_670945 [Xylogone sp. PMI_703]
MNTTTAYTQLECLLLFQSLVAYGTDSSAFDRISDLLKNNTLVKGGDTYDPNRLSVDALRELYQTLLREENKSDDEKTDGVEDGSPSPTPSRKRKLQSPSLKDSYDVTEKKLSILVDRLYARYRDYMIRAIREDERRYAKVQQEIVEIERGDWDERILREKKALVKENGLATPPPSFPQKQQQQEPTVEKKTNGQLPTEEAVPQDSSPAEIPQTAQVPPTILEPTKEKETATPVPAPSQPAVKPAPQPTQQEPSTRPEGLAISDVLNSAASTRPATPQVEVPSLPKTDSHTPQANGIQKPAGSAAESKGPSPVQPNQPSQPQHAQPSQPWEQPYQPSPAQHPLPYPPGPPYSQFNPAQYPQTSQHPQPFPHPPQPHGPPYPGPPPYPQQPQHHQFVPSSPHATVPAPIVLPPPNAVHKPPGGSPGRQPLPDLAGQHYRPSSASSQVQQQLQQLPGSYPPPYPPQQRPVSSNGPPPQWNQPYPQYQPPPQGYPYTPQVPGQRPPYPPRPELIPPDSRQYNSPYNANQAPRPPVTIPSQPASVSTPKGRPSLPSTPVSHSQHKFITGTATHWTPNPTGSTPRHRQETKPPAVEPLSPVLKPAKTVEICKDIPKSKSQLQQTEKHHPKPSELIPRQRGRQRTRAESTASSAVAGPRRSQSAVSHTDELALDTEGTSRRVKQEVATPRGVEDIGDTTADESTVKRKRPIKEAPSPRYPTKRKRLESIDRREPTGPPTQVLWTRAFPKISAQALEAISGHRNASTFAAPVKERDAPGYRDVILRPQDLKSIRSAITAGNRAAAAVAPEDQTQSSIWLPISEDLIPPKGIINFAQLEKELMRMFANAIMFNADPNRGFGRNFDAAARGDDDEEEADKTGYEFDENGVVKETTAMYADVERIISALRSAERGAEEAREMLVAEDDEPDELAGDGSIAKRRRKM